MTGQLPPDFLSEIRKDNERFIDIQIPVELKSMAPALNELWQAQVEKLYKNRHKKSVEHYDVPYLMGRMLVECGELLEQYHKDLLDPNMKNEIADVMNFALLIWIAVQKEATKK